MVLLDMAHIGKAFGDNTVLRDISLSVNEGEVVAIIGPSGSGKSTLLRCATMLETIDTGCISYMDKRAAWSEEGQPATYAGKEELRRIHGYFGLVFQNFNLFPHYSVLRNVTDAPMKVGGVSREEALKEGRRLLQKVGLADKETAYPCELSGGQQQRVAIARALALHPDILCFDEPTSALDPELTGEVLKVIRGLAEQKTTMIIVTHEMAFARDVADQVIFMDGGVIVEQGPARDVIEHPREERTKQFLSRYSET